MRILLPIKVLIIIFLTNCIPQQIPDYPQQQPDYRPPSVKTIPVRYAGKLLKQVEGGAQTKSGISIKVEPVNYLEFSEKAAELCKIEDVAVCQLDGTYRSLPVGVPSNPNILQHCIPQVDIAFVVTIQNDTSHSIDLRSSVIQLEDSRERAYESVSGGSCTQSSEIVGEKHDPKELVSMRVLPGKHREGNIAFCLNTASFEFPGKLLIYDVPVETDSAGNVSRRENFVFPLNIHENSPVYYNFGPRRSLQLSSVPPSCLQFNGTYWVQEHKKSGSISNVSKSNSVSSGAQLSKESPELRASKKSLDVAIQKSSTTGLLKMCWQTYGVDVKDIQMKLTLDPTGSVTAVSTADTSAASLCVSRVLKTLRFDSFTGSNPEAYPLQVSNPLTGSNTTKNK